MGGQNHGSGPNCVRASFLASPSPGEKEAAESKIASQREERTHVPLLSGGDRDIANVEARERTQIIEEEAVTGASG